MGYKNRESIRSWRDHWDELSTMFKYPEQIRRMIYTTNAIENFNRQLRSCQHMFATSGSVLSVSRRLLALVCLRWTSG
ncbi:transposase [Oscillospiraceae bacterium HV4-5-C5C]|nr:transposase [Oscillospiraceae bacterium HV4-5-C5C]